MSVEVSVICITYNQEKYLKQTIESILSQKTQFHYEIVIHDDASIDSTVQIIKWYQKKYPDVIRAIFEEENQFSRGKDFFSELVTNNAKGKYIAICEGDDYWLCEDKLQLQWDMLEKHPECDMCACWSAVVSEDGKREIDQIRPMMCDGILDLKEIILGGGLFLGTAGLFFRKSMYDYMLPFERVISMDYTMQIKGAMRGGICYLDRKMSAYRRYSEGSWTNTVLIKSEKLQEHWKRETKMLNTFDDDTSGKYHEVIVERLKAYIPFEEQLNDNRAKIVALMEKLTGSRFIWGMGRRGKSLEHFFYCNGIHIEGICDIVNKDIGCYTEYGNQIYLTEDVLSKADVILVSTKRAYMDLFESDYSGIIINFQEYMPYG